MKPSEVEDLSYENYKRRIEIFHKKSHDYASEDALSNFKRLAAICKTWGVNVQKPSGCADFLIILKLDRYFNLQAQGKQPKNESLADTFVIDLPNYIDLDWALQVENEALSEAGK